MALPLIPPTKQQEKIILSALSVQEERHYRMVEVFKEWIAAESHLPYDIDESYLSSFLALCKDDLAKTKSKFETLIIGRKGQYYLSYETFLTTKDFMQHGIASTNVLLPRLTQDGYRIAYMAFPKSVENWNIMKVFKFWTALADIELFEDKTAGLIVVADFVNYTLEMITKIDFALSTQFATFLLRALPMRLKNYHAINVPPFGKPILQFLKAVLPAKMNDRVIVHDEAKDLKNYLDAEFIPTDYGGTVCLEDLAKIWQEYYLENQEWKEKVRKLELRSEVPKEKLHLDPSYGFGTEGSFRSLQVD